MASAPFSINDCVLVVSLLYLSIDMQFQTHEFENCHWPVQRWLLVSYIFVLAFRLTHILGAMHMAVGGSDDFLLNLRHKEKLPRVLLSLIWFLVLPLFAAWTGLGSYWLYDSKRLSSRCLPMGVPLVFVTMWQGLSYAWILIHTTVGGVAWIRERRLREMEANLRAVEDPDSLSRWGSMSQLSGHTDLANNPVGGLTPKEIKSLPEALASELQLDEDCECSICLNTIQYDDEHDDCVRRLGTCGHTFHRPCIDLWLLRRADCPLCKQSVLGEEVAVPKKGMQLQGERWQV